MVISVFHSPSMGGEKITLSISGARSLSPWNWRATSHSCLILFILCSYRVRPCAKVLLALTFFLNLVSGLTPRTSTDIPLVSKYLMFSMVLVSLSVVCSGKCSLTVCFQSRLSTHIFTTSKFVYQMSIIARRLYIQCLNGYIPFS